MEKKINKNTATNKSLIIKQLLDRDKIFTKELDPKKTKSSKSLEYEQNEKGTFVVDRNTNLENKRRLISLYTTSTTQKDFIDVVDVEFSEFVEDVPATPAVDNVQVENLSAENLTLKRKVDQLNKQVSQLETNIKNFPVVVNQPAPVVQMRAQISDTMAVGSTLYSDRTGANGGPIQNRLLSKNRKARLTIQQDGTLIVLTGDFDELGNSKGPSEIALSVGFDDGETAPSFFTLSWETVDKVDSYIAVGGLWPTYQHRWRTPGFKTSQQTKLVLDDFGYINLIDKDKIVWSSYGITPNSYNVKYIRPTRPNPVTGKPSATSPTSPTGPTTATPSTPVPTFTISKPVGNSTKMLKEINFKRTNGSYIKLYPWRDRPGQETLMNVEVITAGNGTKTAKFKVESYMASFDNYEGPPSRGINRGPSEQQQAWLSVDGETLEAIYTQSDWKTFGNPIELVRSYKGKVAPPEGILWKKVIRKTGTTALPYLAKQGGPIEFKTYYPNYQPAQFFTSEYIYSRNSAVAEWNNLEQAVPV